jgi:hypothetical protein
MAKSKKKKEITVCVGVGMNQLFPEYITIPIIEEETEQPKTEDNE